MVMECGEIDLNRLLAERANEPLEIDWVKNYWRQMLQAVQVIHDEKIVHSDLKPANFVLVRGTLSSPFFFPCGCRQLIISFCLMCRLPQAD